MQIASLLHPSWVSKNQFSILCLAVCAAAFPLLSVDALSQTNYVPNGNFSTGGTVDRFTPPLNWTSTNILDPTDPHGYLGTNTNVPAGGSGNSARLESHAGQGLSNAFAGTIASDQFNLPTLPSGLLYVGGFSIFGQTSSTPGANLSGDIKAQVINPSTGTADVIKALTFNGTSAAWQNYSAILPDFQSGGPAVFEFLIPPIPAVLPTGNSLKDGHLLVANATVRPEFDFSTWTATCVSGLCSSTVSPANTVNLSVNSAKLTLSSGSFINISTNRNYTFQFNTSNSIVNANTSFKVMDSLGLINVSIDPNVNSHSFSFYSGPTSGLDSFSFVLSDIGDPSITVSDASIFASPAPGPIPGAGILSYLALGLLVLGAYGWKWLRASAVTA